MPLQTPTDRCETRVTSCVSLHQHIALAYSALCVTVSPTPTTQRVFKHPLTCVSPMCHYLCTTHNTACVQIPTENTKSHVSLSLQHPQHGMYSNTHWKQWVLCVTVSPTPTTQRAFKYPLKSVSPMCHCLSNTHNTVCVQVPTENSESDVSSSLQRPQHSMCSNIHWKEWVLCVLSLQHSKHNMFI